MFIIISTWHCVPSKHIYILCSSLQNTSSPTTSPLSKPHEPETCLLNSIHYILKPLSSSIGSYGVFLTLAKLEDLSLLLTMSPSEYPKHHLITLVLWCTQVRSSSCWRRRPRVVSYSSSLRTCVWTQSHDSAIGGPSLQDGLSPSH